MRCLCCIKKLDDPRLHRIRLCPECFQASSLSAGTHYLLCTVHNNQYQVAGA